MNHLSELQLVNRSPHWCRCLTASQDVAEIVGQTGKVSKIPSVYRGVAPASMTVPPDGWRIALHKEASYCEWSDDLPRLSRQEDH